MSAGRYPDDHGRWRRLHPDLWTYHADLRLAGAPVGRRMVAVRRPGAGWALLSPVPLGDADERALLDEAAVEAIVVPTAFHNSFVAETMVRFEKSPAYLVRGARREGLPAERCRDLPDAWPAGWNETLETLPLSGMPRVNEVVFLHAPSRTLLVSDLCFHLGPGYGLGARLLMRVAGAYPGVRTSRLFRMMIRDRRAFEASVDAILERDFDRVVMSHGLVVESDGRRRLAAALQRSDRL